jgi:predicted nucleic acid-binding protein
VIIIADSSPLVALALCDCLDVLDALFGEVRVSQTVFEEVTVGNKAGSVKLANYLQGKVKESSLDLHIIGGDTIDKGELTSIVLYKNLDADYLLIDEKAGRKVAQINQVKIIGSLGVLIEAKRKGIIPLLSPYIEILRNSKTHFGEELLNYALTVVGE